jgi:RNA polymerase sigma factor (sigma-70 family)
VAAVPTHGVADAGAARVAAVASRHEHALLRVARHASLCDDDAHDAYQRALEIFIRRVDTVEPATELAWLRVVVRHEAMAIRRARSETVASEDVDVDDFVPGGERSPDEVIASSERVRRSAEALRSLRPDEARALMMKAHGLSYTEIAERCGWTYTKVNRSITEGRRRFMAAYREIESGAECERFAPIVEALAAGEATAKQVLSIRPHLRHCTACRAAVRDLHLSALRRTSLFWPLLAIAEPLGGGASADRLDHLSSQTIDDHLRELATDGPPIDVSAPEAIPVPEVADSALPNPDAIPVPETTDGALQILLELPSPTEPAKDVGGLEALRHDVTAFFHRAQASDLATGVHVASTGGGGRIATVAAVLGLCLSGAGVGTVCVVTGLVQSPFPLLRDEPPAPREPRRPPPPKPSAAAPIATPALIRATPTPAPTRWPVEQRPARRKRTTPRRDPSQARTPTSHESTPITPAATSSTGQDTFTPEAQPAAQPPTPAPATGGSEFAP